MLYLLVFLNYSVAVKEIKNFEFLSFFGESIPIH